MSSPANGRPTTHRKGATSLRWAVSEGTSQGKRGHGWSNPRQGGYWSQQELVDQVVRLAFETKEDRGTSLDVRLVGRWENVSVGRPQSMYRRLLSGLAAPFRRTPALPLNRYR